MPSPRASPIPWSYAASTIRASRFSLSSSCACATTSWTSSTKSCAPTSQSTSVWLDRPCLRNGCSASVLPLRFVNAGRHPWIEAANTGGRAVVGVSGHDLQAMLQGGRGDQSIGGRHNAPVALRRGGQLAPDPNDIAGDVENPVGKLLFQDGQPGIQFLLSLSGVQQCNPLGQFPQREHADEQIVVPEGQNSLANCGIAPRMANLGEHAGIEQDFQRSPTSRMAERSRLRSTSASVGPLIRYSLKSGR